MPANLSPEFKIAEEKFRTAVTPDRKLAALEEMLSAIPKHKGTEKMQADLKRRISKLRAAKDRKSGAARQKPVYLVEREGAGQIALVGPPNSGKSSILRALTGAEPEIADYPFTTRMPLPGMATYVNVQLQLVDLPPIAPQGSPSWLASAIRMADALALIFDSGSDDILEQAEQTTECLDRFGIAVADTTAPDRRQMSTIVVAAKSDCDQGGERAALLREFVGRPVIRASVEPWSLDTGDLLTGLFHALGIVRMYTKAPGKKPDLSAPFTLRRGATVIDAARAVHKEIAGSLKSARLWNASIDGLMVSRDHVISDEDIIEFRA